MDVQQQPAPASPVFAAPANTAQGMDLARRIARAMTQGALYEVRCHGKPGLVCPDTPGAHADMDFGTFMAAIPALWEPFELSARAGLAHQGEPQALFRVLRAQGPRWEADLLAATGGVNTHRGLLFVGSVACAAAGMRLAQGRSLTAAAVCRGIAAMCQGLCQAEFGRVSGVAARSGPGLSGGCRSLSEGHRLPRGHHLPCGHRLTAGERLFVAHGLTGIRGEAEAGLPTVTAWGLPALSEALGRGAGVEQSMLHALIALMAGAWDTTVAHRGGLEGLLWLRGAALDMARQGGALSASGRAALAACGKACLVRNISPGGAADLLAVTVALYLLEHGGWPEQVTVTHDERWMP
ncbi:MAG: triphosphoribosyl-dephospho-CoA synthase [Desulfovibrionaceae bacterium]